MTLNEINDGRDPRFGIDRVREDRTTEAAAEHHASMLKDIP
jgi:hypothetical protein